VVEFGFRIAPDEAGQRIDKVIARKLPDLGRRAAADLFGQGRVLVDGKVARKGDRAQPGASVTVRFEEQDVEREPDLPLEVVFEAPEVIVVRKPAGQPTAPIRRGETGTLANAILGRFPETKSIGYRPREPGLLHRLDTQTSGLVIVARTPRAFARLRAALSESRIEKRYLAVVRRGAASEGGVIEQCLAPDTRNPRRVRVVPAMQPGARAATTRFRTIRVGARFSLLEVDVSHAYRHQIRAHLSWMGAPIAGDVLYGGALVPSLGERQALHASYVAWAGDDVVPRFEASDPLPVELDALLSE
jgi:23S rRNA pseudouridine1911/1915/1917 synthase